MALKTCWPCIGSNNLQQTYVIEDHSGQDKIFTTPFNKTVSVLNWTASFSFHRIKAASQLPSIQVSEVERAAIWLFMLYRAALTHLRRWKKYMTRYISTNINPYHMLHTLFHQPWTPNLWLQATCTDACPSCEDRCIHISL